MGMAGVAIGFCVASCAPAPKRSKAPEAAQIVVAKVNGAPIYRMDVERELALHHEVAAPGSAAFAGAVDQLVDQRLLAEAAEKEGLDRSAEGRRRLETARERVLSDMLLEEKVRGAATPTAVAGLYQEMVKARPATASTETLEQARPRIARFLTYDRVKDVVLDLRHHAKIEVFASVAGVAKP